MQRLCSALVFAALWPLLAAAESVVVRGGEHEGFTRIVLDLPRAVSWTVVRDGAVRLKLQNIEADFDLSSAERRLNSGRVKTIRNSNSTSELIVEPNCDCELKSYLAGKRMLVLDIIGAVDTETTAQNRELLQVIRPKMSTLRVAPVVKLPLITTKSEEEPEALPQTNSTLKNQNRFARTSPENVTTLQGIETEILERLAEGASSGLLDAVGRRPVKPQRSAKNESEASWPENSISFKAASDAPNMHVMSSIERGAAHVKAAEQFTIGGKRCMSDEMLDIHAWLPDTEFPQAVAKLRRQLMGEFDRTDDAIALALAKTYLAYGLGAEALLVLDGLERTPANAHLYALSDLLEDGTLEGDAPSSWHIDCDTAASLWALFNDDVQLTEASFNSEALLRAFGALPPMLRMHIAPALFERVKRDAPRDRILLKALASLAQRGTSSDTGTPHVAEAETALADGDTERALRTLDQMIESNGASAPEALVAKVDSLIALKQAIPADLQTLVEAYVHEYRRDELGLQLQRANALSLASLGHFEEAFQTLGKLSSKISKNQWQATASYLLKSATENASDLVFINQAIEATNAGLIFDTATENDAAARLVDLGFPEQAMPYLASGSQGEQARRRRILRAKAYLKMRQPWQAEAELLGMTGDDIEDLRVSSRQMRQDYQGARLALMTLGENDLAAEQAWLGSDWAALQKLETQNWNLEQSLVAPAQNDTLVPSEMLKSGQTLLDTSSSLRTLVSDLLERHSFESPGG